MLRKLFPSALTLALFVVAGGAIAQQSDNLPPKQDYRGEIRRGPDGKLIVLPEADLAAEQGASGAAAKVTMVVGAGERISSISEAARLARDGEVIEIRPGTYRGQPAIWNQNNLIIRGAAGERPVMLADGKSAEDKGIWVVRGGRVRIENIEFRG
ncbi:MAG TPA: hypothetical protein VN639_13150, partial [Azonexus sp.]|nr:hypothetical protein [Azonexus sp.]